MKIFVVVGLDETDMYCYIGDAYLNKKSANVYAKELNQNRSMDGFYKVLTLDLKADNFSIINLATELKKKKKRRIM